MPFNIYALGLPGGISLDEPIDWSGAADDGLRPADMPDDAWDALYARLTRQVGDTWGHYLWAMRENADHLAELGMRVHDVNDLFIFEIVQAAMIGAAPHLHSESDAVCPAPGPDLSFQRYFLPSPLYSPTYADRQRQQPFFISFSHNTFPAIQYSGYLWHSQ